MHMFQAEGVGTIMAQNAPAMVHDKSYVAMLPKANDIAQPGVSDNLRTAVEARRHMIDMLERGQYFATYVGHAGPNYFTKYSKMWSATDASRVSYGQFPVMTTACCDVARYDSNTRGIAEIMFHNPNGGAIALFTAGRAVIADSNDAMNAAFIRSLFPAEDTGDYPRLGDAYKASKLTFGTSRNQNKLAFMLLGDPAMQFNTPKPNFKITEVNNKAVNDSTPVSMYAMNNLTVKAQVVNPATGNVDANFNGNAVLTLYDRSLKWNDVTRMGITREIYYPRNIITQVNGTVVNGEFTATVLVPRNIEAQWQNVLVTVYARKKGTQEMVNGKYDQLQINPYDEGHALTDNTAPRYLQHVPQRQAIVCRGRDSACQQHTVHLRGRRQWHQRAKRFDWQWPHPQARWRRNHL